MSVVNCLPSSFDFINDFRDVGSVCVIVLEKSGSATDPVSSYVLVKPCAVWIRIGVESLFGAFIAVLSEGSAVTFYLLVSGIDSSIDNSAI